MRTLNPAVWPGRTNLFFQYGRAVIHAQDRQRIFRRRMPTHRQVFGYITAQSHYFAFIKERRAAFHGLFNAKRTAVRAGR